MHNIVEDIKIGDKRAFKELFEDYYPILCVFAGKYIKNDEVCKDIAQETLLCYWEKRADFEDIYKVKGFLYTVAHNSCLNYLKKEKIGQVYFDAEVNNGQETYFEDNVIEQEMFMMVRKAIESLPPQMRLIIQYAMEGMKNPQIAREMGIAEGTVHSLKKTAYRKLRDELRDYVYLLLFF